MWCLVILYCTVCLTEVFSFDHENATVLLSKYAKVSHWTPDSNFTGRSQQSLTNNGQNFWNYPRNANTRVQTANKPRVIHQYPVYTKPVEKLDYGKVVIVPAVGEVIQDRFNPKPYFDYGKVPPRSEESATYGPPKQTSATPMRQAPPPPVNSFPAVFNVPPAPAKPPVDLYSSPYSSYNPPNQKQSKGDVVYPPLDSYAAPPPSDGNGPYPDKTDSGGSGNAPTLGPPLAPADFGDSKDAVDAPPSDHGSKDNSGGPPNYPPRDEMDVYYPDDPDHSMPMPPTDDHMNMDSMDGMGGMDMDHPKDMSMDLSPPASDDHAFPHYLYDNPHFDHHVYEEVPHTTTQATEDKRVSSTNYSYYYLGRKLWYIPLYFSIYFMIYVTVLILKAIARHKVEFKNNWISANSRSAKQLDFDEMRHVDYLHKNVSDALDHFSRSYSDMAM